MVHSLSRWVGKTGTMQGLRRKIRWLSVRPLKSLFGNDPTAARQSILALAIAALASLTAGLTLAAIRGTLEDLPGLLVMVPAAIAMRGNVYGAMGNRLSTAIHTGTFDLGWRKDSVVGQNVVAAATVTLFTSVSLAVLAKSTAVAFGLPNTIALSDFIAISVLGGLMSSAVLMLATLGLAGSSTRRNWDLDNVLAPIMSAAGDAVTLPALFVASLVVGVGVLSEVLSIVAVLAVIVSLRMVSRTSLTHLKMIVSESAPILLFAALLDVIAGLVIAKRFEELSSFPVLLILVPAFLSAGGAIGGILSSRLSTKLHLGLVSPQSWPDDEAKLDVTTSFMLALPVFLGVGLLAEVLAQITGIASPGLTKVVLVAILGGVLTTLLVVVIGYYGTIAAWRLGVDPDTYGFPLVTSSVDLVGAYAFVLAIVAVGVG